MGFNPGDAMRAARAGKRVPQFCDTLTPAIRTANNVPLPPLTTNPIQFAIFGG